MRDYRELGSELSPDLDLEPDLEPDRELDPEIGPEPDPERGDVPGWVLVTLMTAGLVVALWAIAGPLLEDAFTQAISSVTGR